MDAIVAWLARTRAGDRASILGLLAALVGFAITIWNVKASKAAALRAEEAAKDARSAIRFFDVIAEISTAIAAMEEIRRLHRDAAWTILPDRYNGLRKSLISIRRSGVHLTEDQQTLLQAAIKFLADIERNVDRALEEGQPPDRFARRNRATSEHTMQLHGLLMDLKLRAGAS